jgi:hypothetical protein
VLVGSRAGGFHSRTIEVLDQRGVADRAFADRPGGRRRGYRIARRADYLVRNTMTRRDAMPAEASPTEPPGWPTWASAAHDGPTPTTESLSAALRTTLTFETRARAAAVAWHDPHRRGDEEQRERASTDRTAFRVHAVSIDSVTWSQAGSIR